MLKSEAETTIEEHQNSKFVNEEDAEEISA